MNKNNIDFIFYHSPSIKGCPDGNISAMCAYLFLTKNNPQKKVIMSTYKSIHSDLKYNNTIIFFPTDYMKKNIINLKNRNVLMCDVSFPKYIIDDIIKTSSSFLLIDHHHTAEKDLAELDNKYKIFDMNHSAAWLTWNYFFPSVKVPLLIKYIQSRDIWTKDMENTDAFSYWFDTIPQIFEEYKKYLDDNLLLDMIKNKGLIYQELNETYIKNCTNYAIPKFMKIGEKYYFVVYLNGTILKSDLGNKLINEYSMANFSAIYTVNDKTNSSCFCLRSTDKHTNVGDIAKLFGGGGHRNASGLSLPKISNVLDGTVFDSSGQLYDELTNLYNYTINSNKGPLNVVYLNSLFYKKEIGRYLLQTKYDECVMIDGKKRITPVQEAVSISNVINGYKNCESYDMSVIWSYDGRKTTFYISFADYMDSGDIDEITSRYKLNCGEMVLYGEHHLLPNTEFIY